jgi:hypothetical protein
MWRGRVEGWLKTHLEWVEGSEGLLLLGGDEQYRSAEQINSDMKFWMKNLMYLIPLLKGCSAANVQFF